MARHFRINHRARLDALGEQVIFTKYLELESTRLLAQWLGIPPESRGALYRWLHRDPRRWQRWTRARQWIADRYADRVMEVVEGVTPAMLKAVRKRVNRDMWRAEIYSRPDSW